MDSVAARHVAAAFETLLLGRVLEPLAREDSVLGSFGTTCIAQSIADRDRSGFAATLAHMLERGHG